jgi:hypothetical protein
MFIYEITWHTEPAPGCTFYSGKEEYRSNYPDADVAVEMFKERKAKDMLLPRSHIKVLNVAQRYRG